MQAGKADVRVSHGRVRIEAHGGIAKAVYITTLSHVILTIY